MRSSFCSRPISKARVSSRAAPGRAGPRRLRAEVEHTVLGPLSLAPQGGIEPGTAICRYLAGELAAHLKLALWTEFDGHYFGGAFAHAVADVVPMDDERVAAIVSAAHN
jgi:hypothetical protein